MRNIEYKGEWWLPSDPDKSFKGVFTYSQNGGGSLQLDGDIKQEKQETILGVSETGSILTLKNCFTKNIQIRSTSLNTSIIFVNHAYIGGHFTDEITFSEIIVNFRLLDEWANVSGFDIDYDLSKKYYSIEYTQPEPINVLKNEKYKITLEVYAKGPTLKFVQNDAQISQKTYFGIKYLNEEEGIENIFELLFKLQNFISFSTTKSVRPLVVYGFTGNAEKEFDSKKYKEQVEILYSPIGDIEESKSLLPPEMLFSFQHVRDTIDEKLTKWIEKAEHLEPVFNLYFGIIHNPKLYLSSRFLHLAQAIESYHRRTRDNFELPEEKHQEKVDAIIKKCPEEFKEWLQDRLTYSNEPSLRIRLKSLYKDFKPIISPLATKKKFVNGVVNTRNYLTHFDDCLKKSSLKGIKLHDLTEQLKLLLQACLLSEIGFTVTEIENRLKDTNALYHEIKRNEALKAIKQ